MPRQPLVLALLAAATAILGTAFATPDHAATRASRAALAPLACGIASREEGGALVLEGWARAATASAGDYRFAVTSRGAGGSSRSAQNGTFDLKSKERAVLGQIGLVAQADYEASLVLTVAGRSLDCGTSR